MLAKARGSCFEVQTQLDASRRQGFLPDEQHATLMSAADEVGRLLNGLITRLQKDIAKAAALRKPRLRHA